MGEGFTVSRIVTAVLLLALLVVQWNILQSLEHGQKQVLSLTAKVDDLQKQAIGYPAVPRTGSRLEAVPVNGNVVPPSLVHADGKDEIGRPRAASPGFTLEPPIGKEFPGRTLPRNPQLIPALCGTYNQGEPSEPGIINYLLTNEGVTNIIDREVHERLFTINPDDPTEIWPELAVAWETSDDKLTYRFHLRRGVEFSDGSPLDADDVLFTFHAIMDPDCETEHLRVAFLDVESVRKLDSLTVEVRMARRYWKAGKQFGYNLRVHSNEFFEREIPKKAKELGIDSFSVVPGEPGFAKVFNEFKRRITTGTGPFMWKEGESWVTNQHITLYPNMKAWLRVLNPDHYRFARERWRIIRDQVARQEEFKKGGLDVLVLDHDSWENQFSKDPTITAIANHYVYDHIGLLFSQMTFNTRKFPFDDFRVRRALAHLVDRERIARDIECGQAVVATCPSKQIYPEYSQDIAPRKYDIDEARKLLADAGWLDSNGDGLLDKEGKILEFVLSFPSGRTFFKTVGTMVKESCEKLGIRCKVEPKEWSTFIEDFYARNFELACLYNSAVDPWIDPYNDYHSSQSGPRQGNASGWNNPEVDKLLETMRGEFDDANRTEMFHRFNRIYNDDLPVLLLVHGRVGVVQNKRIQGAKIRPTGLRPFDLWIDPKDAAKDE